MRTLVAVAIGVALLSGRTSPDRAEVPTVQASTLEIRTVRSRPDLVVADQPGTAPAALFVERPIGAKAFTTSSVFVVDASREFIKRTTVEYGLAAPSELLQIVSGVASGDQVVISDMRAWDAFERMRLRR